MQNTFEIKGNYMYLTTAMNDNKIVYIDGHIPDFLIDELELKSPPVPPTLRPKYCSPFFTFVRQGWELAEINHYYDVALPECIFQKTILQDEYEMTT